jgi:glycerol kinase
MKYILALDQGTTSSRAIVFDHSGAIVAVAQRSSARSSRNPAGSSTTPTRSGHAVRRRRRRAAKKAGISSTDIAAIGITNQRETTVVWERATGRPFATRSSGRTAAPPAPVIALRAPATRR